MALALLFQKLRDKDPQLPLDFKAFIIDHAHRHDSRDEAVRVSSALEKLGWSAAPSRRLVTDLNEVSMQGLFPQSGRALAMPALPATSRQGHVCFGIGLWRVHVRTTVFSISS